MLSKELSFVPFNKKESNAKTGKFNLRSMKSSFFRPLCNTYVNVFVVFFVVTFLGKQIGLNFLCNPYRKSYSLHRLI